MVTWGANYTFAKNLATAASYNNQLVDPVNLRNDYNPVPYDRTQVFNIHYLVDLGTRYKGGNLLFKELANGWQVSGISQVMSGFPLASENGNNFGFGYAGFANAVQVSNPNQANQQGQTQCENVYGIKPDKNGNTFCVNYMNPVVWLGTPDVQMMPGLVKGVSAKGGSHKHQFINPLAFGVPAAWDQWGLPAALPSRSGVHGPRSDGVEEFLGGRRAGPAVAHGCFQRV